MDKPRLLLIGSMTHSFATYPDGTKEGFGGGVRYGGITTDTLKVPTRAVTIGADDIQPGVEILNNLNVLTTKIPRPTSNNFSNDYRSETRKMFMRSFIQTPFRNDEMTVNSDCDGVLFFPGYQEITPSNLELFRNSIILLDLAGLIRKLGPKNENGLYPVIHGNWENMEEFKKKVDVLKVSHEDLAHMEFPEEITDDTHKATYLANNGFPIVLFTRGGNSTILAMRNKPNTEVPTYKVSKCEPAGAGEVFSVGFVVEYFLTKDPVQATAFGNACASFKISEEDYNYEKAKKRAEELLKKA